MLGNYSTPSKVPRPAPFRISLQRQASLGLFAPTLSFQVVRVQVCATVLRSTLLLNRLFPCCLRVLLLWRDYDQGIAYKGNHLMGPGFKFQRFSPPLVSSWWETWQFSQTRCWKSWSEATEGSCGPHCTVHLEHRRPRSSAPPPPQRHTSNKVPSIPTRPHPVVPLPTANHSNTGASGGQTYSNHHSCLKHLRYYITGSSTLIVPYDR